MPPSLESLAPKDPAEDLAVFRAQVVGPLLCRDGRTHGELAVAGWPGAKQPSLRAHEYCSVSPTQLCPRRQQRCKSGGPLWQVGFHAGCPSQSRIHFVQFPNDYKRKVSYRNFLHWYLSAPIIHSYNVTIIGYRVLAHTPHCSATPNCRS